MEGELAEVVPELLALLLLLVDPVLLDLLGVVEGVDHGLLGLGQKASRAGKVGGRLGFLDVDHGDVHDVGDAVAVL